MPDRDYLINQIITERKLDAKQASEFRKANAKTSVSELTKMISGKTFEPAYKSFEFGFKPPKSYGLELEKTSDIQIPLRPKDEFWENTASDPAKFNDYLNSFKGLTDFDKNEFKEILNENNVSIIKAGLEAINESQDTDKYEHFSNSLYQIKDVTRDRSEAISEIIKQRPKSFTELPSYFIDRFAGDEFKVSELKNYAKLAKMDTQKRIDNYEIEDMSRNSYTSEQLSTFKALLEAKNNDGKYKFESNYQIKELIDDKKYNQKIVKALANSSIELNNYDDTYLLKKISDKKNSNAVAEVLEIGSPDLQTLSSLIDNYDLKSPTVIFAIKRLKRANEANKDFYSFENAAELINVANKTQDMKLIDLLIEKNNESIEEGKPNVVTEFFGAKAQRPKYNILDINLVTLGINQNNKEFFKKYLKENKFDGATKETTNSYFTDEMKKKIADLVNVRNASELLLDDTKYNEYMSFKNPKLRNLKYNHPEVYKKLEDKGVIVNDDVHELSEDVFRNFGEHSSINQNLLDALKAKRENKPFVKEFDLFAEDKELLENSQYGDVVSKSITDLYVNEGDKLTKLEISPYAFKNIFNPISNYDNSQGNLGNCYQDASQNAMMNNPKTRIKVYKMFSSPKVTDVQVTIPGFKESDEPVKFENMRAYNVNGGCQLKGSEALKMLEQAFAVTAFDHKNGTNVTVSELKNENDWTEHMKLLSGGRPDYVLNALLGQDNAEIFSKNRDMPKINESLVKLSKGNTLMCFGTRSTGGLPESELNLEYDLVSDHAYTVIGYDPKTKMIQYSNPHSAGKVETVRLEKILPYIDNFYAIDILD